MGTSPTQSLRQPTETEFGAGAVRELSPDETAQVLHELREHQIELEQQNEASRRTQTELEVSRAHYLYLYNLAPVGYVTLNEQGLILEANSTTAAWLGATLNTLVTQPLTRFILPENQETFIRYRQQLFDLSGPQACELRMLRQDGSQFWVWVEAIAAQDADGTRVGHAVDPALWFCACG